MNFTLWILFICCSWLKLAYGQGDRIAPGVPPQHYQQQYQQVPQQNVPMQHGQQYNAPQQQQQMHHQQMPVQQQQVPMHQQVPVQHHQVPQHQQQQHQQPHGHGHAHHGQQQVLNAANIAQEKDHIKEHMEVPLDTSKMTEQELQFHYFKMHDADNNNKLDGCELIKSLIHWHEHGGKDPNSHDEGAKIFPDEELLQLIEPILQSDDTNQDGFIDYPEFIQAQQKNAAKASS
ncbi:multiple coagulation factor deficiency protein 2 homolog isoform X1 [Leptopilina heterotoma]|uniref:multiple coagulation factor deficiency protein 2 homolog isoform X1 n=1 Tax=Leptopilina heterotoma TaxID=63436 RepID=UPI001CA80B65|nr:multiple coagulation factor deficiency protein 2 homolog isoform X1 [Leptopilina heterotoma]